MEDLLEKRKKLICELVEDEKYVPMKEKELAIFMQVKPEDRRELKRILEELLEEGKIEQTKRGRYVRAEKKLLRAVGLYQSSENFGFVVPDNKKLPDIFIPREKKKDAYDGAKVVAEYIESREEGKSPEGEIIEVLGGRDEPGIDMLSVVRALGIPDEFPESSAVVQPQTPLNLDNSHTIEVVVNDITIRITNSADPILLTQTIKLLRMLPY